MKSLTAVVTSIGAALLLSAVPAHAAPAPAATSTQVNQSIVEAVPSAAGPKAEKTYRNAAQRRINFHRTTATLKKLDFKRNQCLGKAARRYAVRSAAAGGMVPHNLKKVAKRCKAEKMKELLGVGFPTGKKMVDGWVEMGNSQKRAIFAKKARVGASGAAKGDDGLWYGIVLIAN